MKQAPERAPLLVFAAFSGLIILGGVLIATLGRGRTAPARDETPPSRETAALPPPVERASPRSISAAPAAPAAPSAKPRASANAWPEPLPVPGVRAVTDPNFGDPFDGDGGPGAVRVLTTVGAFRLGVTKESMVRDEPATAAVLKELGAEIDAIDQGRTDSYEKRVVEYQSILDRYRARLRPLMEGSFALKGNGWSDTERVLAPPRPGPSGAPAEHEH